MKRVVLIPPSKIFPNIHVMIYFRFNPTRPVAEARIFNGPNRCIQCNHIHGGSRHKPTKTHRSRPARNHLRIPFPFLDHLKSCRNPDEFLPAFRDFHRMGHRHGYPSYASLVYRLARARKFDDVETVLDFLRDHDIRCEEPLFIGIMRHYGNADMVDRAIAVFREMGSSFNCPRTLQSFNTVLNVLVERRRISEAIELFESGPQMGFRRNSVSYNIMIKLSLDNGEWEDARKLFDEMLERELGPTLVTYNSLIGFLCRNGKFEDAKKMFDDMNRSGKRGNPVTYALLMECLCGLGKFNEAKKMMFDMEYHGCKTELVNYGVLMTDLVRRGLIDEAKKMLTEMKKRRIKPDVVMYNILINYFRKEGLASDAYKILIGMQVDGCNPNAATYRMVVDCFCRAEDFMGGLKVLNAMLHSNHAPRIETFCSIGTGLLRSGDIDSACFVLEEMGKRGMCLATQSWEVLVGEVLGLPLMCISRVLCLP